MQPQHVPGALETEIQSFAATLDQCFRGVAWDVVNDYAAIAWDASDDRAGARWPEVTSRVRAAWQTCIDARSPEAHHVLAGGVAGR